MKKIIVVVAPEKFRDEEYAEPKTILEKAGVEIVTASTVIGAVYGKIKMKAESEKLVFDVSEKDYDGIFFVGGPGSSIYFNDKFIHKLAWSFYNSGKLVAAICIAPTILANAGLLKGKRATVFPDGRDALTRGGAVYTPNDVEVDGNIITGNGPQASQAFAGQLLRFLNV